ncbi:response regulator [Salibacter halophilus]|uniref:Response regulator n=1 Tax=Salibacter halophilus TaxID=1803916 RepID=A0A6N6M929_9FLAO|nr:response regulator [Salibacter halophilus]KAB1063636.1 response regulator [Salibacter halophilus]
MKTRNILVIEDELDLLNSIKDILELKGYHVFDFSKPQSALNYINENKNQIDLILSDIMMPEMSGFELLREIRSNSQLDLIPFVFLTAKIKEDDVRHGFALGADDYIKKPFEISVLSNSISAQLKKRDSFLALLEENSKKVKVATNTFDQLSFFNSHVLRAPLANILTILEEKKPLNEEETYYIKEQAKRIDRAVMLLTSKMSRFKGEIDYQIKKLPDFNLLEEVVFVDDDNFQVQHIKMLFERFFPHIKLNCFSNPLEVINIKHEPQLLITDINMPEMSGFELIETLSSKEFFPPTVILTSSIDLEDLEKAMSFDNVFQFLRKPFTPSDFKKAFINNKGEPGSIN